MKNAMVGRDSMPNLGIFGPPYRNVEAISTKWQASSLPPQGKALVWQIIDGQEQQDQFRWLESRPFGLPLIIILPPAPHLEQAMPLLRYVNALRPKAVLPNGSIATPRYMRNILSLPPRDFARTITNYFVERGLLESARIRGNVARILALAPRVSSISSLVQHLCTSRRTLGRHFATAGLPAPSHWLQFSRLLYATTFLQHGNATVFQIASRVGYPDGFTMSNQMKRVLGFRPSDIRTLLGWEWIVESWIKRKVLEGGIDHRLYGPVVQDYRSRRVD